MTIRTNKTEQGLISSLRLNYFGQCAVKWQETKYINLIFMEKEEESVLALAMAINLNTSYGSYEWALSQTKKNHLKRNPSSCQLKETNIQKRFKLLKHLISWKSTHFHWSMATETAKAKPSLKESQKEISASHKTKVWLSSLLTIFSPSY